MLEGMLTVCWTIAAYLCVETGMAILRGDRAMRRWHAGMVDHFNRVTAPRVPCLASTVECASSDECAWIEYRQPERWILAIEGGYIQNQTAVATKALSGVQ
jgi:hypothetical protein